MRHGIRQTELAELIGYEQTYISALEVGKKGPSTPEFVERLISALMLSAERTGLCQTGVLAEKLQLACVIQFIQFFQEVVCNGRQLPMLELRQSRLNF